MNAVAINSQEEQQLKKCIEHGLSEIKKTPNGKTLSYSKLTVMNLKIENLNLMKPYIYIQDLNLSGNCITDLNPLSSMKFLARLNVSNNNIADIEHWKDVPKFLEEIDLSRNRLRSIQSISRIKFLQHLCIDDNMIFDFSDIAQCSHLKTLDAAKNNITNIYGIRNMNLVHLNLSENNIPSLRDLPSLPLLEECIVSGNMLFDLLGIQGSVHTSLRLLDISDNEIDDPTELLRLKSLVFLSDLTTDNNPFVFIVQQVQSKFEERCLIKNAEYSAKDKYRLWMIYHLDHLNVLDGIPVSTKDVVRALNYFDPPLEVISAVQHGHLIKQQVQQPAKLRQKTRLTSAAVPPIVICGDKGAGKRTLTKRLSQSHPSILQHCLSYTTRPPQNGEVNGKDYHFVSDEEIMTMFSNGELLEIFQSKGYKYGFRLHSIDDIAEQGKVCLMNMELEGAITLFKAHIHGKFIYIKSNTDSDDVEYIKSLMKEMDYTIIMKKDWDSIFKQVQDIALNHVKKVEENLSFPTMIH